MTYDRSAVEPVAASTANETPTSEKVAAIGAITRSASKSRKLRLARTGKRPASARARIAGERRLSARVSMTKSNLVR